MLETEDVLRLLGLVSCKASRHKSIMSLDTGFKYQVSGGEIEVWRRIGHWVPKADAAPKTSGL